MQLGVAANRSGYSGQPGVPLHGDERPGGNWLATSASYAFAFALGLYICLSVFPVDFIFPPVSPGIPPTSDLIQHITGQRYFIADAWRWPLLEVPSLNFPDGVHIGFTDSIPALALPLKALSFLLPEGFHGFGLWYAFTWIMQPVAAVWCLRAAGERRLVPALCIAVVAIAMPTWWSRFFHASLTGHFLIWFALGTSLYLTRDNRPVQWVAAALLQIVILLVHPYLWAMTAVFLLGVPLTHLINGDARWRVSLPASLLAVGASILVASLLGYFGAHGGGGFGIYGMNLLSPFWPAGSSLLPFELKMFTTSQDSGWEGYQYLGAGVLFGLISVIIIRRGAVFSDLRAYAGFVLAALFLIVFSMSSNIGIGNRIFENAYATTGLSSFIESLFAHFRSSGRMFWPVGYLIVLAVVAGLARVRGDALRVGLLIAVAALQFADNTNARSALAQNLRNGYPGWQWLFDVAKMREAVGSASTVRIYPRWECVPGEKIPLEHSGLIQLLSIASETVVPVNTMYVARWHTMRNCNDEQEVAEPLAPGETRVLGPTVREAYTPRVPDAEKYCQPIDPFMVCRRPAEQ